MVNGFKISRTYVFLILFLFLPSWAQQEPCGFFEINGVPGFDEADFLFAAVSWGEEGRAADFDSNGIVDVIDLVRVAGCMGDLSHGLLARYYGFEDGDPDQDIPFPDFDNLPGNPDPVVINVATTFSEFSGYAGFLNSDMRYQFGSTYDGYLFVPESGEYTFTATGTRGLRLMLDGNELLFFDGSPANDQETVNLDYGLHPIHMEFYTDYASGSLSLSWRGGGVIGSSNVSIHPDYIYHVSAAVPTYTGTDLEIVFDPPSGSLAGANPFSLDVYALGPNSELSLTLNGEPLVSPDGKYQLSTYLPENLSEFLFEVSDSDGRIRQVPYRVFSDPANIDNKVKTPLEFLTGLVRVTEAYPVTPSTVYHLNRMGMTLWDYADPTGFPEEGVAWIDTNSLLERWNLVHDFTGNRGSGMMTGFDARRFFAKYGARDGEQLLDYSSAGIIT